MKNKFIFDGKEIKTDNKKYNDVLNDGYSNHNLIPPSELGEALQELNKDEINEETNMTDIDLRTRLNDIEIGGIMTIDTLVSLNVLPIEALSITRQKKRLNVSKDGKGRDEIVSIVSGDKAIKNFGSQIDEISRGLIGNKK